MFSLDDFRFWLLGEWVQFQRFNRIERKPLENRRYFFLVVKSIFFSLVICRQKPYERNVNLRNCGLRVVWPRFLNDGVLEQEALKNFRKASFREPSARTFLKSRNFQNLVIMTGHSNCQATSRHFFFIRVALNKKMKAKFVLIYSFWRSENFILFYIQIPLACSVLEIARDHKQKTFITSFLVKSYLYYQLLIPQKNVYFSTYPIQYYGLIF